MPISPRQEALLKRTFIDFHSTQEILKNPVVFHRAEGLYLWDIDGKRYFDAIGGVFVATLWHRHPRVMEAMRRQIDTMTFAPPLHGISDVTLDFVEKIGSVAPAGTHLRKALQRRIGSRRSGQEVRPAVLQANRASGQVQVHQPVS